MTQLESLPNDLLLELFDYFDIVPLIRVFAGLNSRFHTLLVQHFRAYHVDFQHMSKGDFDMLCQRYFGVIADRIVSCRLIDKEETSGLLDLFHSRGFRLNQFLHLKSLTLRNIHHQNIAEMLDGLVHLVELSISYCDLLRGRDNASYLIHNRPNLKRCELHDNNVYGSYFSSNTQVSSTLEHLTIQGFRGPLTSEDLVYLFLSTPRLRVLSLNVELLNEIEHEHRSVIQTSIRTLKLRYRGEVRLLGKLLQSIPNLRKLTIDLMQIKLNGYEWEKLIRMHAPQLKTLRFEMTVSPYKRILSDAEVDALLDTFRTPFWLREHQWYVRCDAEHRRLYTIPYAFDSFTIVGIHFRFLANTAERVRRSKWTCPDDSKCWLFHCVQRFDCSRHATNCSYLHPICFPNIEKLQLQVPSHEAIWCSILTFDHLTTLHISICEENSESSLQGLFDRAPHLYTLTVSFFMGLPTLMRVFQLRSASIRRLRLTPYAASAYHYLNDASCATFANSPLVQQCEVLELRVLSADSILTLISSMSGLRAMTVHVRDDEQSPQPRRSGTELVEWMRGHLSPSCSISSSVLGYVFVLKIWFG